MKTHAGLDPAMVVVVVQERRGRRKGRHMRPGIFSNRVSAPKRNVLLFQRAYCARHGAGSERAFDSNDRAMNANRRRPIRRAILRKIEHFSGNPGASRRVAPRDSFRFRSGFGPVSAEAAYVAVAFSRHSSIIRATKRALFQIFASTNIFSPMQLRATRARSRIHVRRAYTGAVSFESFVEFPSYQDGM